MSTTPAVARLYQVMAEPSDGPTESPSSFDDFFDAMLPRVIEVARRVTGDQFVAEDVAVEALARAHARWSRVGRLEWREGWVLKVASREALRHLRREPPPVRRRVADESDLVVLRAALEAALASLPRRQREAIVLRYLCDLPEAEVAKALGVSTGSVKTHLHRALASMRTTLGPDFEEVRLHELHA